MTYQFSGVNPRLDAGSGLPWLGTFAAPQLVNLIGTRLGAGAICGPPCMLGITLGSALGFANNALILQYDVQVNLADKRMFLHADNACYLSPPDESSDLWK